MLISSTGLSMLYRQRKARSESVPHQKLPSLERRTTPTTPIPSAWTLQTLKPHKLHPRPQLRAGKDLILPFSIWCFSSGFLTCCSKFPARESPLHLPRLMENEFLVFVALKTKLKVHIAKMTLTCIFYHLTFLKPFHSCWRPPVDRNLGSPFNSATAAINPARFPS